MTQSAGTKRSAKYGSSGLQFCLEDIFPSCLPSGTRHVVPYCGPLCMYWYAVVRSRVQTTKCTISFEGQASRYIFRAWILINSSRTYTRTCCSGSSVSL